MTDQNVASAIASITQMASSIGISNDVEKYSIDGRFPQIVAKPTSIEQVSEIMRAASEYGAAIAPWGGGTHMMLGNPIARYDAVIDLSGLNRVVRHNYGDLTATVEAGATLAHIQEALKMQGQFLAIDAPLKGRATLGGTLAAGVSGPLKWHYGSPRDTVIGLKVVQPDGVVTKSGGEVVKNVSGYDMARLHIGGLGTLGIIVEVSLKLTPLPRHETTLIAAFDDVEKCLAAGLGVFNSHVMPLALSSFDSQANEKGKITNVRGGCFLGIRFGGRPRTVERQVNDSISICRENGASSFDTLDGSQADALWRKIADFGWDDATTPLLTGRVFVRPSAISEVIKAVKNVSDEDGLRSAEVSHVGYGAVQVNWFDDGGDVSIDTAASVLRRTLDIVHKANGRMIIELCPTEAKSHFDVWDEVGEPLSTMRRMKEQYDPKGVLNPGRFAGGI